MNTNLEASNMPKQYARRILFDSIVIPVAFYLALLVQYDGDYPTGQINLLTTYIVSLTIVHILVNAISGIYRQLWAYADLHSAWHILRASAISTLLLWGGNIFLDLFSDLNNGVIIIAGLLNALLSTGFKYRRFLLPISVRELPASLLKEKGSAGVERALIVGANTMARQVASQLAHRNDQAKIKIFGYIDDDPEKKGMAINGLKVIGVTAQIPELVRRYAIDIVIIAVEDMSPEAVWQIISICQETPAQIKVLPDIPDLMNQQYEHPLALRELRVEDLLNRRPMQVDAQLCRTLLKDKVVLVTGAAGSIGSELCYQLCRYDPAQLLVLDNNETGLFDLNLDLNRKSKIPILLLLADITNRPKMESIFRRHRPHVVFHAAAYKHVPLLEMNPDQSLKVNIKGTMIVSEMAHKYGTQQFVFISSDKAVKPSSVMGASKYVCELWLQALNKQSSTRFTIVRFGNVIGSRGSVLPIFADQIEQGGPVTVTHKAMKRFFMSIPEAVNLVLQAAAFGQGGELFMLDMGEEVRIQDLAERMIRLKGLRVYKDIPIQYIGIRPGEKLREELYYDDEQRMATAHPRVFQLRTRVSLPALEQFQMAVDRLETYSRQPDSANHLRQAIFQLATHPSEQIIALNGQTAVPQPHVSETPEWAFV